MDKLTEGQRRLYDKLHQDLGVQINDCLLDSDVNEVMLNPDSKLWIDRVSQGMVCEGEMNQTQAFAIIHTLAGIHDFVISRKNPHVEAELPLYKTMRGERFTAQIPPLVAAPSFSLRKRSEKVFTLDDYVASGRLSLEKAAVLRDLVKSRKNILVSGGPGTGKSTVTNALIVEAVKYDGQQRFVILEDLPELQCRAQNQVSMLTTREVNMTDLLRDAMRMRPDRILIGEVRGREALAMLKAWNTGCPGGICTVHANGAEEAIQRILDLTMEAGLTNPPVGLVSHTIDAVVSVVRRGSEKGFIDEILSLGDYQNGKFAFKSWV